MIILLGWMVWRVTKTKVLSPTPMLGRCIAALCFPAVHVREQAWDDSFPGDHKAPVLDPFAPLFLGALPEMLPGLGAGAHDQCIVSDSVNERAC
jgi:hypothetical protein